MVTEIDLLMKSIEKDGTIAFPVPYGRLMKTANALLDSEVELIEQKRLLFKGYGQNAKVRCLNGENSYHDVAVALDYVTMEYAAAVIDPNKRVMTSNVKGKCYRSSEWYAAVKIEGQMEIIEKMAMELKDDPTKNKTEAEQQTHQVLPLDT